MMALRIEPESTPLQEKLNDLAEIVTKLGSIANFLMLVALLILYFAGWRYGVPDQATTMVLNIMKIVIVAVVPEDLPLALTLTLAYATQRMLKDNNLVRTLAACEITNNVITVFSDKTSTNTQNKMTVVAGTLGSHFGFFSQPSEGEVKLTDIHQHVTHMP